MQLLMWIWFISYGSLLLLSSLKGLLGNNNNIVIVLYLLHTTLNWKYFHELHFISHIGWNFCIDIRFSIAFSLLGFE